MVKAADAGTVAPDVATSKFCSPPTFAVEVGTNPVPAPSGSVDADDGPLVHAATQHNGGVMFHIILIVAVQKMNREAFEYLHGIKN